MPILLTFDPLYIRLGLAALVVLLAAGGLVLYFRRLRAERLRAAAAKGEAVDLPERLFDYASRPGSSPWREVFRALLILLSICVAAALILIVVPERSIDRLSDIILRRTADAPPAERISLLYLGDEVQGKEFHIRGVIRNISTQPIEQVDATIRLYASDGTLLETTVVRMETETIAPDATASFHLLYPDYDGKFGSYTVDFKLRQGEALPYKDLRGARSGD